MAIQPTKSATAHQHKPIEQASPLVNLPVELIQKVLGHVHDIQAILACGQTCKIWNVLLQKDPKAFQCFWKYLVERDFSVEETKGQIADFQEAYKTHYGICTNLIKWAPVYHVLAGHKFSPQTFFFTEGKLISGSSDKKIKIWDLEEKKCLHTLEGHTSSVGSLFYANGLLFSGSHDTDIKVWDLRSNKCLHTLGGHTGSVTSLIFAEGRLISGSMDWTIKIWDWEANKCLHTLEGHGVVTRLLFVEGTLISSFSDGSIKIWNLNNNTCLHTLIGHEAGVSCFLAVKGKLISGSHDKTIKIWDRETNECLHTLYGHTDSVTDLLFAEGKLLSYSLDNEIKIWDLDTHACLYRCKLYACCCHYAEGKLILGRLGGSIEIWDFNPMRDVDLSVCFDTKYGNSLVLCGEGGGLSWNPAEGKPLTCKGTDRWTISIPHGAKEFKLVWKKKGESYVWEKGPNRKVEGSLPINITHIQFKGGK